MAGLRLEGRGRSLGRCSSPSSSLDVSGLYLCLTPPPRRFPPDIPLSWDCIGRGADREWSGKVEAGRSFRWCPAPPNFFVWGSAPRPFSFSLREGFVLPVPRWLAAGLCAPAHRACRLLRPRPEGAIRAGAPRRSQGAAPPSPQHGSRVRCPRAPERSATRGTGAWEAPLPNRAHFFRGGERESARRVGRPSLRRPRGPQRADPGRGVGDAAFCGHRGAPPRDALLGRGRRSLGAPRAGASQRRAVAHPPGKTKASRSGTHKMAAAPGPRGRRKPPRSGKQNITRAPAALAKKGATVGRPSAAPRGSPFRRGCASRARAARRHRPWRPAPWPSPHRTGRAG